MSAGRVALPFELPVDAGRLARLTICGCGTAYFAGLMAKYWFERFAALPVDVEIASEFRYRDPPLDAGGLLPRAQKEGVAYLPGRYFAVSRVDVSALRLSFAGLDPDQIRRGLRILGGVVAAELAESSHNAEPAPAMV